MSIRNNLLLAAALGASIIGVAACHDPAPNGNNVVVPVDEPEHAPPAPKGDEKIP